MIVAVRGEDEPSPGGPEWPDAGELDVLRGPQPLRQWRGWWVVLAAAVIGLIVVLATRPSGRTRQAQPTGGLPSRARSSGPRTALTSASVTPTPTPAVRVTEVGHPMLGITANWDLFARGASMVVRIEFARGRITRTVFPGVASSGAVSFLAAPHAAIIRPWDFVPGYLVPDGQPPRLLAGALASGGVLLPGPAPGQFWMQTGQGGATAPMALVGPGGHPIASARSARITIPSTMNSFPAPDGAGYPLLIGPGGSSDVHPAGLRHVTSGAVLAVGPTRWLAAECTRRGHCALIVIDQASGARHALHRFVDDPANVSGVISPDGHTAALLLPGTAGAAPLLHLVDLNTGSDRRIAVRFNRTASAFPDDPLIWSPDSRWLFAADSRGQIHAVNTLTGRAQSLGLPLPPVEQLATR